MRATIWHTGTNDIPISLFGSILGPCTLTPLLVEISLFIEILRTYCLICLSPRMAFALYRMLFGIVVFCPETETAAARFLVTPPDSSYAVEGMNFTLEWTYTLDGIVLAAGFFNVTGTKDFDIGSRNGPGKIKSQQKYEARFRAQVKNTGAELTILEVQSSDEGTYKLSVVSSRPTFIWDSVRVIVHSPPSNIITSSDLNVTAPAQLTLNCSADGKPKPTITWTRVSDGTVVTMPLNITGGKKEESYQCTAYNGVGNRLTKVVKISLLFHPKVTAAQKVYVGHGQTALLTCEVEGNPTPIISWSPCPGKYVVCDKRYLNISKVQTARANYTCTATNALGVDSATTVLLIGGKNIYLRLSVSGESDNKDSVWETIEKEFPRVFANATHNYSGAELLNVSFTDNKCGSLNFDVVLKFTTEVAEDDTISIIQNAIVDGKIGELSYNSSCIIGIQTTVPLKDNKTVVIICAVLGIVACIALIGFIIWCVHKKKCCSEAKDKTDTAKKRGDKEQDVAGEVTTPMLLPRDIPVEETNQSTVQALPMYARVDKTKKTSDKGGGALRRPCDEQDAEVEHMKRRGSFTEKSPYTPVVLPNEL